MIIATQTTGFFLMGYEYNGEFKCLARGMTIADTYNDWHKYAGEEPVPMGCQPIPATEAAYTFGAGKRVLTKPVYSHGALVGGLVDVAA